MRTALGGQSEASLQTTFFVWLFYTHRAIYDLTFAIPNGGTRNAREGAALKRQGVKRGVADVFMAFPVDKHPGLFIEFKVKKNKLTPGQINFKKLVEEQHYCHAVCYNLDEATKTVTKYIEGTYV